VENTTRWEFVDLTSIMICLSDLKQYGDGLSISRLVANSVVEAWARRLFKASRRVSKEAIFIFPSREKIFAIGGISRILVTSRKSEEEEEYHLDNLDRIS
jgi:hypothetical protein